jgi:hypothetical protein
VREAGGRAVSGSNLAEATLLVEELDNAAHVTSGRNGAQGPTVVEAVSAARF